LKKSVSFFHGRHSTANLQAIVDTRPSTVKAVILPVVERLRVMTLGQLSQ
jgi:hypothetical protein